MYSAHLKTKQHSDYLNIQIVEDELSHDQRMNRSTHHFSSNENIEKSISLIFWM